LLWRSGRDQEGRTIWIADAHCDDGKRHVVHAEEKLTAFLELERAIQQFAVSLLG
jgi:SH3-like domain-containing protein